MDITLVQNAFPSGGTDFGQASFAGMKARLDSTRDAAFSSTRISDSEARDKEMRKTAEDFEAVFMGQMLAPMFSGLSTDGPMGGGHAEEVFRSMMVDELGNSVARSGGIGIADTIYKQLLTLQEI
ncbi:hypothetical protein JCM17846_06870 [Iodidimonas nitroreducens]|uniref:Flagellar protein FlgJ N-terminal domain-containing protein n=1 Tax=Iodidimonas nitroreducens TaxID=1236968 RepID=A0A5A7N5S9_9PROT|nr:rod-binding protein [Iodidimonas nitroreducens]GAK32855.1 chemotactic signal-response protein CheL [alpha proteobacterium Q-1]GER03005.1 hypothetical protein JCM17846_06870 [Iodidimonas nitroreducens]